MSRHACLLTFLPMVSALALTGALAGCQDFHAARQQEEELDRTVRENRIPSSELVSFTDEPWIMGPLIHKEHTIPAILRFPASITIARPVSVRDAALLASEVTHIPVVVSPDAEEDDEDSFPVPAYRGGNPVNGLPPPPSLAPALANSPDSGRFRNSRHTSWTGPGVWLKYSGTRDGLFQAVANRFGIWQKYENGQIVFYRTESRTFTIPAFEGKTRQNATIVAVTGGGGGNSSSSAGIGSGAGSSGGSSGGSTAGMMSSSREGEVNPFDSLEKTARIVAGGGKVMFDRNMGMITVSGTPPQVARVEQWVKNLSDSLLKQIAIDVHVYTLQVTRESALSFSPKLALESLGKAWGGSIIPAATPAVQSLNLPFSAGAAILGNKGTSGQFNGTQMAVNSLAQFGNVTEIYDWQLVTTNGYPASFQNGINTTCLQSSQSWLAANTGTSSSLVPGVMMQSFSGEVTPRIEGSKILLRMSFLLQTLLNMNEIESNGSKLQLPTTSSTTLDDQVVLQDGQTLVIQGYVDNATSRNRNGSFWSDFWGLGSGGASNRKTRIYVIVSTRLLDTPDNAEGASQ